jgi:hypothetical protein
MIESLIPTSMLFHAVLAEAVFLGDLPIAKYEQVNAVDLDFHSVAVGSTKQPFAEASVVSSSRMTSVIPGSIRECLPDRGKCRAQVCMAGMPRTKLLRTPSGFEYPVVGHHRNQRVAVMAIPGGRESVH